MTASAAKRRWRGDFAAIATLFACFAAVAAFGAVDSWGWASVAVFVYAALIGWLAISLALGRPIIWHPLLWPTSAFGLLVTAQYWGGTSVYPGASLTGLIQLAACGCVFYLGLSGFRDCKRLRSVAVVIWAFTGCLASEAIIQHFVSPGWIYGVRDASYASPMGPYVYHNHFAGCMDLLVPIAVCVALMPGRRVSETLLYKLRWGTVPALAVIAVFVSGSRGGVLTLAFEALIGWLMFNKRKARASVLAGTAVITVLASLVLLLPTARPLLQRFRSLSNNDASVQQRMMVGETCLRIFETYPLVGTGFNTFATVYPQFESFDSGLDWEEAHDDFAQMLAETGTTGLICVIAFLVLLGQAARRLILRKEGTGVSIQRAALVGVIGFLFHSFGDFQFHAPANAFLFFCMVAMAVSGIDSRPRRTSDSPQGASRHSRIGARLDKLQARGYIVNHT